MRRLSKFGKGDRHCEDLGIDLNYLVGWLQSLCDAECENLENNRNYDGPKWQRYDKAQNAVQALTEILEQEPPDEY